jgi:hypothetical protein
MSGVGAAALACVGGVAGGRGAAAREIDGTCKDTSSRSL